MSNKAWSFHYFNITNQEKNKISDVLTSFWTNGIFQRTVYWRKMISENHEISYIVQKSVIVNPDSPVIYNHVRHCLGLFRLCCLPWALFLASSHLSKIISCVFLYMKFSFICLSTASGESETESCSAMPSSLNSPGQNTGVGSLSLL